MRLRPLVAAGIAAAAVFGIAGAAFADQFKIIGNAPVFPDQYMEQASIGTIPAGTMVQGSQCGSGVCFIDAPNGPDGWVSATYIAFADGQQSHIMAPPQAPQQQQPQQQLPKPQKPQQQPQQPQQPANNNGLSLNFNFDTNPAPKPKPSQADEPRVCFFSDSNFKGNSFCASEGDNDDALPDDWNDRISSIEVDDGLTVEVCRNDDMDGTCKDYDTDIGKLPSSLNNRISSYEIN